MRTVREVLEELTSDVMPPRGIAIEIKEMPSKGSKEPNWVAKVSAMIQTEPSYLVKKSWPFVNRIG
jgi:hypothetical protein